MAEDKTPITIANLLARVDASWNQIDAAIRRASAGHMVTPAEDGWSPKDHVAHLAMWRRSLLALLDGLSRPQAIGLDDQQEEALDTDGINALLFERNRDRPLDEVVADLRDIQARVRERLASMTDADLLRAYSHYQPNDGEFNPRPVIGWIAGNTFGHDEEHLPVLEAAAS